MMHKLWLLSIAFQFLLGSYLISSNVHSIKIEDSLKQSIDSLLLADSGFCSLASFTSSLKLVNVEDSADTALMVYLLCHDSITSTNIGNHLFSYFLNAACAKATGAHFLAPFLINNDLATATKNISAYSYNFYDQLPSIVQHNEPKEHMIQTHVMKDHCFCHLKCFAANTKILANTLPWMVDQLQNMVKNYKMKFIELYGEEQAYTHPITKQNLTIPLIPDVAIHYRCGDIVDHDRFPLSGVGLMPFSKILNSLATAGANHALKTIYIIPEFQYSHNLHGHHRASNYFHTQQESHDRCHQIYTWLYQAISNKYPTSNVILLPINHHHENEVISEEKEKEIVWKQNAFLDFVRLASAKIMIGTPTSFAFMATISHNHSSSDKNNQVYFPHTNEITTFLEIESVRQYFQSHSNNIHWIESPELLSQNWPNPWTFVKFDLLQSAISTNDLDGFVVKGRGKSVYLISKGERHAFDSGSDFEAMGFNWGQIVAISDTLLNSIPEGSVAKPKS